MRLIALCSSISVLLSSYFKLCLVCCVFFFRVSCVAFLAFVSSLVSHLHYGLNIYSYALAGSSDSEFTRVVKSFFKFTCSVIVTASPSCVNDLGLCLMVLLLLALHRRQWVWKREWVSGGSVLISDLSVFWYVFIFVLSSYVRSLTFSSKLFCMRKAYLLFILVLCFVLLCSFHSFVSCWMLVQFYI